jgi:hypothetical protein
MQPLFIYLFYFILFFLWVLRNPHSFLVGTTQPSYFLWVLRNPHISCGYYATLLFLVGTTQPSYFLWVLRNPLISCGYYATLPFCSWAYYTTLVPPFLVLHNRYHSISGLCTPILSLGSYATLFIYLELSTVFLHSGAMKSLLSLDCSLLFCVGLCTHTFPPDSQATLITLSLARQLFFVCRRLSYSF